MYFKIRGESMNNPLDELKACHTIYSFKELFKNRVIDKYKTHDN